MTTDSEHIVFIEGRDIYLRPLLPDDYNMRYLAWLNDPEVNFHSKRRFLPTRYDELQAFDSASTNNLLHLAICTQTDHNHVGNISLGPINWFHRCAEVRILIGQKTCWGKGIGAQAIYLVAKHAFQVLGLNRLEAGSINPAFNAVVIDKLGWREEGRLRSKFNLNGAYVDIVLTSQLKDEFSRLPQYEAESQA